MTYELVQSFYFDGGLSPRLKIAEGELVVSARNHD